MKVTIRLYATLKDRAGAGEIVVSVPDGATVGDLLAAVITDYPALAHGLGSTIVAVNRQFADEAQVIGATDEVALFPPVSGGMGELAWPTYFALAVAPPDVAAIRARLLGPDVGAVVTFTGAVRGETARAGLPERTLALAYEAYEEMATERMAQIAREIWAKWPLVKGIAIVQRVGRLGVGEVTTLVMCAAGHRDEGAFEAARYGIDRLKEIVPVWKKEVGVAGDVWVEGSYRPSMADNE